MRRYAFKQVDVFTARPFMGNPVAVVLGAEDMDPSEMQRIAAWTNLSETTFVLPPTSRAADYRLRIFTPVQELAFAGHPTIGSAHAVLESGGVDPAASRFAQECAAGVLPLSVEGHGAQRRIFVQVPEHKIRPADSALQQQAGAVLDSAIVAAPLLIDVGPVWIVADLGTAAAVEALHPDAASIAKLSRALGAVGITVFGRNSGDGPALRVRSFAPAQGVFEDPVCGSGNACVAAFLMESNMLDSVGNPYSVSQGTELGRDGRVYVRVGQDRRIEIGGPAVTCVDGYLSV
ncbi:MAG: PhzF family phenazine biosynthesis protein [Gammaproteobacteria bacterium]|nr:PhzF family phenazine biosynthesis protein [Gammaproteobacteria bacterium]